jgi:hypothetical protein
MNGSPETGMKEKRTLRYQVAIAVIVILLTGALVYGLIFYGRPRLGIEQPIPFSHRVHANDKKISCFFCHPEAMSTARAGVPPLETCMLCHARIAITYPPIAKLRKHYFGNKPVLWARVHILPEFVYFDHSMHIHRQIDCSRCHGNVPHMDRIVLQQKLEMGFCIGCHKDNYVTHDCFVCHR